MAERNQSGVISNPLVTSKSTPLKRLGLSHKRKSSFSNDERESKIFLVKKSDLEEKEENVPLIHQDDDLESKTDSNTDSDEDKIIIALENRDEQIKDNVEALKDELGDLENLVDTWKTGCRNALAHLMHLVQERHSHSINVRKLLQELGIWETMSYHFQSDSELSIFNGDEDDEDEDF